MSPARDCAQTHCGVTPSRWAISSAVNSLSIAAAPALPNLRHQRSGFRSVGGIASDLLYDNAFVLFALDAIEREAHG
jgi:hypothetical protein